MQVERATAADFQVREVAVALPEPQAGKLLEVVVRSVDVERFIAKVGGVAPYGLPGAPTEPSDGTRELALMREVAALGIVSPTFSFGPEPEPDKAWWGMVRPANRVAIVNGILAASEVTADGGPLGRFPADAGGAGGGAGAGRTGEAATVGEPASSGA